MAFIVALAALLIAIQVQALLSATRDAASAYMDATSTKVFGRLQTEITAIASLVNVLATSSSVADSNERTETGRAIPLFKAALQELIGEADHVDDLARLVELDLWVANWQLWHKSPLWCSLA
jgi:adenylate cyclase